MHAPPDVDFAQWKNLRVFISSTFRDMNAERNHLVSVVMPELREWCRRYRLHLYELDLRWGIVSTQEDVVQEVCLRAIEDCEPFFLGILGDRYGSVFPGAAVSVTHAEIQYAAAKRSFHHVFALRTLRNAPPDAFPELYDDAPDKREKQRALREQIRGGHAPGLGSAQIVEYTLDCLDPEPGLRAFGEQVQQALRQAFAQAFAARIAFFESQKAPRSLVDFSAIEVDRDEALAVDQALLQTVLERLAHSDVRQVLLTGEGPYVGLRFLMALYGKLREAAADEVVVCVFQSAIVGPREQRLPSQANCRTLPEYVEYLTGIPVGQRQLCVLVEGFELIRLFLSFGAQAGCRVIAFSDDAQEVLRRKLHQLDSSALASMRDEKKTVIALTAPSVEDKVACLTAELQKFGKQLTAAQIALLRAKLPGYGVESLPLLAQEIRHFGNYDLLEAFLRALPDDALGMTARYVDFLTEQRFGGAGGKALGLIAFALDGLSEALFVALGQRWLPPAQLQQLLRYARYLIDRRGDLIFPKEHFETVMKRKAQRDEGLRAVFACLAEATADFHQQQYYLNRWHNPALIEASMIALRRTSAAQSSASAHMVYALADIQRGLVPGLFLDASGAEICPIDEAAVCVLCHTKGIRHAHQDIGLADSYDIYLSYCPVCRWGDCWDEHNYDGSLPAKFNRRTNQYEERDG